MGRILLQRVATGATGVKQARYRRRPTRGSEALVRAGAVYTQRVYCSYSRSLALAVNVRQCVVSNACILQCLYMNSAEGFALYGLLISSSISPTPMSYEMWPFCFAGCYIRMYMYTILCVSLSTCTCIYTYTIIASVRSERADLVV